MKLTDTEKRVLDGSEGWAKQTALSILKDLGELYDAPCFIPVSSVHIDMTLYLAEAGLDFTETMAEKGGRFSVPTSLNPSAADLLRPEALRVSPEICEKNERLDRAFLSMGAAATRTCAPYQSGLVPRFGEHLAWGESNAIAFSNSIIGARTNRIADLMDVCAAVAGRTPLFGLHITENRKARKKIVLDGFTDSDFQNPGIYPLIGFTAGKMAGDDVAAVSGMPAGVPVDSLKGLLAGAASSGAVGLMHLVGITPEAQTEEMCLAGNIDEFVMTPKDITASLESLTRSESRRPELVVLGCPHYSFQEFRILEQALQGRKIHHDQKLWAFTSRAVYAFIAEAGILGKLVKAGVNVFTDACPLFYPSENWHFETIASDSAKFVNYCHSQTGRKSVYLSTSACVETAVAGKIPEGL